MTRSFFKNNLKTVLAILYFIFVPFMLYAQAGPPGDDTVDTPLDGGVSLLIAGGVAYGMKKYYSKNNRPKTQQENKSEK